MRIITMRSELMVGLCRRSPFLHNPPSCLFQIPLEFKRAPFCSTFFLHAYITFVTIYPRSRYHFILFYLHYSTLLQTPRGAFGLFEG